MITSTSLTTNITPKCSLYRAVFTSWFSSLVVFVLLASFVLQPIEQAQANEEVSDVATEAETDVDYEVVIESDVADVFEEISSNNESPVSVQGDTQAGEILVVDDSKSIDQTLAATLVGNTTTNDNTPAVETETTNSEDTQISADTDLTEENIEVSSQVVEDTAADATPADDTDAAVEADSSTDSDIIVTDTSSTSATSTEDLGESVTATASVTSDEFIQFDKRDCVSVSDGSFYCNTVKSTPTVSNDGLFALPDSDGDLEIFLKRDNELIQITFNTVDDAAPQFDAKSNTLVWHRQVNERFQIISYDLDKNKETQLTFDNVNNMEPSRFGDYTTWQHWNKNNWDIMLYDGKSMRILEESTAHDIAPQIRGDLVMWYQHTGGTEKTIELYDLTTGERTTINDSEGGALSNPRLVLVYEAEFENGDVITKGYDVLTGEIAPLSTKAAELPEEIPTPDSTGETRALLSSKTTSKEDGEIFDDITPQPYAEGDEPLATSSTQFGIETIATSTVVATTTGDLTLDLNPVIEPVSLTDFDIIVPSFDITLALENNLEAGTSTASSTD